MQIAYLLHSLYAAAEVIGRHCIATCLQVDCQLVTAQSVVVVTVVFRPLFLLTARRRRTGDLVIQQCIDLVLFGYNATANRRCW